MIFLLSNNIHMHMKMYKFRIRFETYKKSKIEICTKCYKNVLL